MKVLFLALSLALLGCSTAEEAAPTPRKSKAVDLDALAAQRASSDGARLEKEAADARSASSRTVYASGEGEAGLAEIEAEDGEAAAKAAVSGGKRTVTHTRTTEIAAPSDLDLADDGDEPWINMDLVSKGIRARHRKLQTCWDDLSGAGAKDTVTMRISVDRVGQGSASLAASSANRNPELARCLAAALSRVDYPEAKNGSVAFDYPLTF